MLGAPRIIWQSRPAQSLLGIMKAMDLHLVVNPTSNLVKLFDSRGRLLRQSLVTSGRGSSGCWYPGRNWTLLDFGECDMAVADPRRRLMWVKIQLADGPWNQERWFFVGPDFEPTEAEHMLRCHYMVLEGAAFRDIFERVVKCGMGGGTAYAEFAAKAVVAHA